MFPHSSTILIDADAMQSAGTRDDRSKLRNDPRAAIAVASGEEPMVTGGSGVVSNGVMT